MHDIAKMAFSSEDGFMRVSICACDQESEEHLVSVADHLVQTEEDIRLIENFIYTSLSKAVTKRLQR